MEVVSLARVMSEKSASRAGIRQPVQPPIYSVQGTGYARTLTTGLYRGSERGQNTDNRIHLAAPHQPVATTAQPMTLIELINHHAQQLEQAGVAFGHGTTNAFDEAAWLTLWQLGLPLDSPLHTDTDAENSEQNLSINLDQQAQVAALFEIRIATRQPAAYLTREAWLQGVPFYVDERVIIPRSLIAEVLAEGSIDVWLTADTHQVLDLCKRGKTC